MPLSPFKDQGFKLDPANRRLYPYPLFILYSQNVSIFRVDLQPGFPALAMLEAKDFLQVGLIASSTFGMGHNLIGIDQKRILFFIPYEPQGLIMGHKNLISLAG